jgi:hypothetical protein
MNRRCGMRVALVAFGASLVVAIILVGLRRLLWSAAEADVERSAHDGTFTRCVYHDPWAVGEADYIPDEFGGATVREDLLVSVA